MKNSKTGFENSLVLFGCSTNPVASIAPQKLDIKNLNFGMFFNEINFIPTSKS